MNQTWLDGLLFCAICALMIAGWIRGAIGFHREGQNIQRLGDAVGRRDPAMYEEMFSGCFSRGREGTIKRKRIRAFVKSDQLDDVPEIVERKKRLRDMARASNKIFARVFLLVACILFFACMIAAIKQLSIR